YDVPPSTIRDVISKAIATVPGVLPDPPPGVKLKKFGDSAIEYLFYFFIDDYERSIYIESDVNSALWYALKRAGIGIPFPIRHVMMESLDAKGANENVFEEAEKLLGDVDFLKVLEPDVRVSLARQMKSVQYGAHETIVKQGD